MRLPAPRGFAWLVAMATFAILLTNSLEPTSAEADETSPAVPPNSKGWGAASPLPLPHTTSIRDMESKLFPFVRERKYVDLGWSVDKSVRDTGPYIRGWYYGTHPVVRVYYSPEMIKWLNSDRLDHIPDGATMIKEQYSFPAAKHEGKSEQELIDSIRSWTVMIKDAKGSHD